MDGIRLRTKPGGGCIFSVGSTCTLGDIRPTDCRLFPLDIWEIEGQLYWVKYEDICLGHFAVNRLIEYGKSLLPELLDCIDQYATVAIGEMGHQRVRVLERVVVPIRRQH